MDDKKFYRVDYKFIDLDKGVDEDFTYVAASTPEDAPKGLVGTDFIVREASQAETEAYISGFEDGYDIAVINERLKDIDLTNSIDYDELDALGEDY